jgi:hypothetical protein
LTDASVVLLSSKISIVFHRRQLVVLPSSSVQFSRLDQLTIYTLSVQRDRTECDVVMCCVFDVCFSSVFPIQCELFADEVDVVQFDFPVVEREFGGELHSD